jgi:hypothetical protein
VGQFDFGWPVGLGMGGRADHISFMRSETFTCPHCGSEYEVTYAKVIVRDQDTADCVVCGKEMARWSSSRIPLYKLVKSTAKKPK